MPVWFWIVILVSLFLPFAAFAQTVGDSIGGFIGGIMLSAASTITWSGGLLLQYGIENFILEIGDFIGNKSSLGLMIGVLWGLVRDMCNLAFIFGFIYIGIRTIIDADDSNAKRVLASLIIGALLINFSLYFTKVIIDISNYTAVEIYDAVFTGAEGSSISTKFAETIGLYKFYNPLNGELLKNITFTTGLSFYFMASLFLMVAGFVFAAGGLLLIVRFVALVFIMIFSPILFAATVFPATSKYASDLWHKLINYAFFAPAYLIMLLISTKIVGALVQNLNKAGTPINEAIASGKGDSYGVILIFFIGIMSLVYSLKVAQQIGIVGADRALAVGKNLRGRVQSAVGRNTVGFVSHKLKEGYESVNARSQNSRTGRIAGRVLKYGSFGALSDRTIRGTLEAGEKAKFGGQYSHADDTAYDKEQKKRQATLKTQHEFNESVGRGIENSNRPPAQQDPNVQMEMEKAVAGASLKFLEELDQKEREKIVDLMTDSQFEGLQKSAELSETDKSKLNDAKKKAVEARLIAEENKKRVAAAAAGGAPAVPATLDDVIGKASGKDLNALGIDHAITHAGKLSSKQMDEMTLTPTAKTRVKDARNAALTAELNRNGGVSTPGAAQALLARIGNDTEISKLPPNILTDQHVARELNANVLTKMLDNDGISPANRATIKGHITRFHGANALNNFFNTPIGARF